jgi:rhamnosyltransferase
MSKPSASYISVFIPTYNGEKYIAECIEAILHQELPTGYKLEVLVTDSGSTDRTLEILRQYQDKITLNEIPNAAFGHGRTRQHAAQNAKGEFILYLSQDATPAHYRWLINMIEPFFLSERVGCVFGRQQARIDAAATIKREVNGVFGGMGATDAIIIHRQKSLVDNVDMNALNVFFSDVNSAARRSLLIGDVPYRDVPYAEDQALAEDMQQAGYLKAYAPQGEVWHSNEYTAKEYFKRKVDEYLGLYDSLGLVFPPSKRSLYLGWIRPTLHDYRFILKDRSYGPRRKLLWLARSPFYNRSAVAGKYHASKNLTNATARKKHSLEASRKAPKD